MENMIEAYAKDIAERKVLRQESRPSQKLAWIMQALNIVMALIASQFKLNLGIDTRYIFSQDNLINLNGLLIFVIIIIMIGILAARRTVYYSPKLILETDTLIDVLRKWRKVDAILMKVALTIPLLSMLVTLLGIPFERSVFIFVGSTILFFILMPMGIKTRSKLQILRRYYDKI